MLSTQNHRSRGWLLSRIFWLLPAVFCVATLARAQAPQLSGIAHIALRVGNLDASTRFYEKLGFEQAFALGGQTAHSEVFLKINDRQFLELYVRQNEQQPLGLMHFCYESANLQALHDAYIARGLEPTVVRKAGAGNLLFTLRGPENENIEFTQYMPGSRHWEDRGRHLGADRVSTDLAGGSLIVQDPAAARQFYTEKLGFALRGRRPARLHLPGSPEDSIHLEPAHLSAHAKIEFAVDDPRRAAVELRKRGFAVHANESVASIADPDGNLVVFRRSGAPGKEGR